MKAFVITSAILIVFTVQRSLAQNSLSIRNKGLFGHQAELLENDRIEYKSASSRRWNSGRIASMSDTAIGFQDDRVLLLRDLTKVRIHSRNALLRVSQKFTFGLGVMFFTLNTANQLIIGDRPVVNPLAAVVSGSLVSASLLLKWAQVRIVRVRKGTAISLHPVAGY